MENLAERELKRRKIVEEEEEQQENQDETDPYIDLHAEILFHLLIFCDASKETITRDISKVICSYDTCLFTDWDTCTFNYIIIEEQEFNNRQRKKELIYNIINNKNKDVYEKEERPKIDKHNHGCQYIIDNYIKSSEIVHPNHLQMKYTPPIKMT